VEPPHTYLRAPSGSLVHHADYLDRRSDHALCGLRVETPTTLPHPGSGDAVCPDCEAKLVYYHLHWWREQAETAIAELQRLRAKYGEEAPAAPEPVPAEAATSDYDPTTLLGRAQRELDELCRQFAGEVPYFRLKNAMQAFSDSLDTLERAQLAQEIGADGSLIRWATGRVQARGWRVTNSPVHTEAEEMWEAWHHESYAVSSPSRKTSKWRFGRR